MYVCLYVCMFVYLYVCYKVETSFFLLEVNRQVPWKDMQCLRN